MKQNETAEQKAQKKPNKVLNVIVTVLLAIVIVFGIIVAYTAFTAKQKGQVPSIFGFKPLAIQSDSMSPTFDQGDLIIVKEVADTNTLEVGDIITFHTVINGEQALNTHRIIAVNDGGSYRYFSTKGDNNSIEDGLTVRDNSVEGKYVTKLPGVGNFIDFLQTSKGFLLVIVLPCAIFFIYQLIVFFKALFAYQAEKTRLQFQAQMQAQAQAQAPAPAAAKEAAPEVKAEEKAEEKSEETTEK